MVVRLRVLQTSEGQRFSSDACMARKAGIWVILLIYRYLQNTLTKIFPEAQSKHSSSRIRLCTKPAAMTRKQEASVLSLQETSGFDRERRGKRVTRGQKLGLLSMILGEIVDGRTGVTTVYEEMPVFIKLLIVKKFNL